MAVSDEDKKTITTKVIDWAAGQPFNNVLLLMILFGGAWMVTTVVPQHLQTIQNGYREVIEFSENSHREERERTQQMYDKWLGRGSSQSRDSPSGSVVAQP